MSHLAELGLGAARFGSDCDATGARARVGEDEVRAILDTAQASGLTLVDTAPRFGESERLLGCSWPFPSPFRVTTKTLGLDQGLDRVEARARRSLERMGLARGHALFVDGVEDLLGPDGRLLWARLEKLKDEGLFQKIGVSIDDGGDAALIARRFQPDVMQVPCSLLDQSPEHDGVLSTLKDLGVEVQLRSIFMGGLMFAPREALPAELIHAGPRLSRIRLMLAEAGADPLHAALAYARSRPQASAVIVGVGSAAELRAILAAAAMPVPDLDWRRFSLDQSAVFSSAA